MSTETTTEATIKTKKQELIELSQVAKMRQESDCEGMSINEILIDVFYTDEVNTVFHTFWDWKYKGYKIKKGAKAFLIWGRKRSSKKEAETETNTESDEANGYKFFPVCYLFSNNQVEPIENAENN